MSEPVPTGTVEAVGPVRPGDVLVFRLSANIQSREQFHTLVDELTPALKEKLPDVEFVFVGGVDQIVHYRPEVQS